jgi:hypothetical protein
VILARLKLRRPDDLPDPAEIDEAVRALDRELDGCFMAEVAPALERARRARESAA